jgi:membrane protease subunit HflC
LRAKGSEAAERIRADADRQRTVILADAYREAEQTRGQGDAKASEIFADAFKADPEFYAFYRSLDAYRQAFAETGSTLVLAPDSDFFKFFNQQHASPAHNTAPSPSGLAPAAADPAGLSSRVQ